MKTVFRLLTLLLFFTALACSGRINQRPHIEISTNVGNIELELYPDKAPGTVTAFLSYVDSGYYRNSTFYRVLNVYNQPSNAPKAELIQGGLYRSRAKRGINP